MISYTTFVRLDWRRYYSRLIATTTGRYFVKDQVAGSIGRKINNKILSNFFTNFSRQLAIGPVTSKLYFKFEFIVLLRTHQPTELDGSSLNWFQATINTKTNKYTSQSFYWRQFFFCFLLKNVIIRSAHQQNEVLIKK